MLKLLTICTVLCAFFLVKSKAYRVTENSFTFASNVNEYTVSLSNTSLNVNSTDKNLKPCTIAINSTEIEVENRIQAKGFDNGRKIIVWGIRIYRRWRVSKYRGGYDTEYTVLLVDPWTCSYKSVAIPKSKRDGLNQEYDDILVVTNTDSFDVFLPGLQKCSPCRFDFVGNTIELEHQIEFPNTEVDPLVLPHGIFIEPIHPIDRTSGYFIARNFENHTAVIEHVDQDFKTLKQLHIEHPVHSVSIWPGKDPLISICYASYNNYSEISSKNFTVHCQQLDSNFHAKISIHYLRKTNNVVYGDLHLTHQIDPLGNIYIGLVESTVEKDGLTYKYQPQTLEIFACDKSGNFLESQDFDIASSLPVFHSGRYSDFLYSYLLVGDKFCLANDERISSDEVKDKTLVRCFDIHNYYTKNQ